jgi:quercetin dioxygenase-like cupin family protein
MKHRACYAVLLLFVVALPVSTAQAQDTPDKPVMVMAKDLAFGDIAVPGFPAGMKIAVLSGDPNGAGPYTIRLKFPDKYAVPAHWHPNLEYLTVIEGKFYLGMGDKVVESAEHEYHEGDYLVAPAKQPHFGHVKGETIVQLHGTGPFAITVVGQ